MAFNKTEISLFFELLGQLMEKHRFVAKNIYNCDETGISTVQTPGKILAAKGQKRVGSITSWERGKNITLLCAMSAAGGYIPPMFIFPRKRLISLLEKDGPAGALYKCSDNGWINEHLFVEWLAHLKQHAKSNHMHMLSLPPHTSHRTQPLDVSFFGPLKMAYKKECDLFLKSHLVENKTPYDVASLVRKAFNNIASISKGESGFRSTKSGSIH
ncbi:jerky protein homolog [Anoplophora glabripennis]|uniref:jerky protein homolog n=1 Tax=Anoplophora glabripennis TaxID=217634 RepID=UPI0008752C6F|nr:jerky protein homolog [Anoplophora glabripennis]